jgi:Zn-dependent metalloprotease
MKKLIILLLSILLSLNLTAQELTEKNKIKMHNLKHFEVEYTQDGAVDKETGFLRVNNSENFNSEHKDAKNIAMDYLQNKLEIYGLTDLSQFRIRKVAESLTGEFVYFDQYIDDIPIYITNFTIFIDKEKTVRFVSNDFRNIFEKKKKELLLPLSKKIEYKEALEIAKKHLNISEVSGVIGEPGGFLTYLETKNNGLLLT